MTTPPVPRYLSQLGVGTPRICPGQYATPAPRSYLSAAHAQLANPEGVVYVGYLDEENDRLHIEARLDCYPLDVLETRIPGLGCNAEGAHVLRDLGPRQGHRWSTHFRNDQLGGYHNGVYHSDFSTAVEDYAEGAARALKVMAARFSKADA